MQVIEELIKLAKDLDAATKRGEDMGLTDDEIAFFDALAANDSAKHAMGDDKLKVIAAELISQVKKSVTIDWTLRESARVRIKVMVKRILNKHGDWLPRCRRSVGLRPAACAPRSLSQSACGLCSAQPVSVGLRPVLRAACLSRPAPSARRTCRKKR